MTCYGPLFIMMTASPVKIPEYIVRATCREYSPRRMLFDAVVPWYLTIIRNAEPRATQAMT